MEITHIEIDSCGFLRVQVVTDSGELLNLKLGSAKEMKIESVKDVDEKAVFALVDKLLADRKAAEDTAKAEYPDMRLLQIDAEIVKLTEEKAQLETAKEAEEPVK